MIALLPLVGSSSLLSTSATSRKRGGVSDKTTIDPFEWAQVPSVDSCLPRSDSSPLVGVARKRRRPLLRFPISVGLLSALAEPV